MIRSLSFGFTALSAVFLMGCTPEHSKSVGFLEYQTDPGYVWVDPDAWFLEAKWMPGIAHRHHETVISAQTADQWLPMAGYQWGPGAANASVQSDYSTKSSHDNLEVHWHPGAHHPEKPHITAAAQENYWRPDKGYYFPSKDSLDVRWRQGVRDPDRAHYISGAVEGAWELEPGYVEVDGLLGKYASWSPGLYYPGQSCLVSTGVEGKWDAVAGHHLETLPDGRLKIVANSTGQDWGTTILAAAVALFGYSQAQPQEGDGFFKSNVVRPLSREVGDAGMKTVVDSFRNSSSTSCSEVVLGSEWRRR